MAGRLAGKVAIITGAASGMGLAAARLFAQEGASVVCADRSGAQDDTAKEIGGGAIGVQVDVSSSAQVEAMVGAAVDAFGTVDVLFNNAGFGGAYATLVDTDEETFDRIMGTNLKGVYLGMKHAIPVMTAHGGGSIINTVSAAALVGMPNLSVYGGAKGGVVSMSKSAALDFAAQGVRVNCICPGVTWTGLAGAGIDSPPPATLPPIPAPIPRWGLASDIANAALYLASDESSYVTGQALAVDGGYTVGTMTVADPTHTPKSNANSGIVADAPTR